HVERRVHVLHGQQPRVAHAAPAADLDGAGGGVDRHDVVAFLLEVEGDAACTRSDIEHAPSHESQRAPLPRRPAPVRGEIVGGAKAPGGDETVLALDDLGDRVALERREHHLAVRVAGPHRASSDSTVGSRRRRGGRTSRHVQSCGSLSGRKRIKRVPCRKRFFSSLSKRTSTTSSGRTGFQSSSFPRDQRLCPPGVRSPEMNPGSTRGGSSSWSWRCTGAEIPEQCPTKSRPPSSSYSPSSSVEILPSTFSLHRKPTTMQSAVLCGFTLTTPSREPG